MCNLKNHKTETPTHYVGITGKEYPFLEFANHGWSGIKNEKKDLPVDEYPFTIKYKTELMFNFCENCNCEK